MSVSRVYLEWLGGSLVEHRKVLQLYHLCRRIVLLNQENSEPGYLALAVFIFIARLISPGLHGVPILEANLDAYIGFPISRMQWRIFSDLIVYARRSA